MKKLYKAAVHMLYFKELNIELVCRSVRGSVTIKLQGHLKSEHLVLMQITVGEEAEHKGVKRIWDISFL